MKKFTSQRHKTTDGTWEATIFRNKTSRGSVQHDKKTGFPTESEAIVWAALRIVEIVAAKAASNKQRSANKAVRRREQSEAKGKIAKMTCVELATFGDRYRDEIISRAESLWEEVVFRAMKSGASEREATEQANKSAGRNSTEMLVKAANGDLDTLDTGVREMAIANARRLAMIGFGIIDLRTSPNKDVIAELEHIIS